MGEEVDAKGELGATPVLVSTGVTYCITHQATDHDGRAWTACRFRQLFYFENPMDEHTYEWNDDIDPYHSGSTEEANDGSPAPVRQHLASPPSPVEHQR